MKTVKLKSNGLGRYDDVSPFMVTDNKLEILSGIEKWRGEELTAHPTVKNN